MFNQDEKSSQPNIYEIHCLTFSNFFVGARIDHGHHYSLAALAMNETVMLSDTVAKVIEMVDLKDTLVVVTADHGHAFTFNGYPSINTNVLGKILKQIFNTKQAKSVKLA